MHNRVFTWDWTCSLVSSNKWDYGVVLFIAHPRRCCKGGGWNWDSYLISACPIPVILFPVQQQLKAEEDWGEVIEVLRALRHFCSKTRLNYCGTGEQCEVLQHPPSPGTHMNWGCWFSPSTLQCHRPTCSHGGEKQLRAELLLHYTYSRLYIAHHYIKTQMKENQLSCLSVNTIRVQSSLGLLKVKLMRQDFSYLIVLQCSQYWQLPGKENTHTQHFQRC